MAGLERIWIERDLSELGGNEAIRLDWDNDRHHRIEIKGVTPDAVCHALREMSELINAERAFRKI